jgi:hypothetical protein
MKTLRFLGTALIATLMCVACSNEEIVPEEQDAKYVTVDLGVTGEYLKVSESPLGTRTSTTADSYGINVYTITTSGKQLYATGCFMSLSNIKIKLLDGQKYNFEVGIFIDDDIHPGPDGIKYYSVGFQTNICDEFTYTSNGNIPLTNLYNVTKKHDYFYGEIENYTPSENGTVEIPTKRVAYGAHYIAEGLDEGVLNIEVKTRNYELPLYHVNLTSANPEDNGIYTFLQIKDAWYGSVVPDVNGNPSTVNYYTTKQLNITWTKDDGSVTPLGTFDVTFKRNIKTTIVIKVEDPSQQNGIVVTKEETRMTDDENKYVIEGGTITEVPVTSQQ